MGGLLALDCYETPKRSAQLALRLPAFVQTNLGAERDRRNAAWRKPAITIKRRCRLSLGNDEKHSQWISYGNGMRMTARANSREPSTADLFAWPVPAVFGL